MRLFLLISLTMMAFAANSILNRMAVGGDYADPGSFAILRVLSGAGVLWLLTLQQRKPLPLRQTRRWLGASALSVYLIGFSLAYLTLDAGLGALILFGVVQIVMFVVAALTGAAPTPRQLTGAGIAFAGLCFVLWPGPGALADPVGAALMVLAGAGWAVYTLAGRAEPDALSGTASNFIVAAPLTAVVILLVQDAYEVTPVGVMLAVISGAITSGLGYALWYRIVPQISAAMAATVQLSVPVIALFAGGVLLGETINLKLVVGAVVVLCGIALSIRRKRVA